MKHDTPFSRAWKWTIQGALFWWVLGLNLGFYHLSAGVIFFRKIFEKTRQNQGVYLPATLFPLIGIFCAYSASVLMHYENADSARLVAAFYNLSFWVMGMFLVVGLANIFSAKSAGQVAEAFQWPAWISGFLSLAMFILWLKGSQELEIRTPFYWVRDILGSTALVENSVLIKPLMKDWFASSFRPRFNVFSPYATASGGLIVIFLMMILTDAEIKIKSLNPGTLLLFAANFCALFMTLSRTALGAWGVALAFLYLLQKKHSFFWIFIVLLILLALAPVLERFFEVLVGLREGSNTTRMEIYRVSLQQLEGVEWIFGLGLKPRSTFLDYPLGSHSTYISLIYKSGLLGFFSFLWFQASLFLRWYKLKEKAGRDRETFALWKGLGLVFISMSLWMITEDIDAPQFLAFIYFSLVGIFEGFRRSLIYES